MVDRAAELPRKVLVVEDDEALREVFVQVLSEDGHNVLEAPNGKEGLGVLEKYSKEIGTVFVDHLMPIMGGEPFIKQVRKIDPERSIRVVLISAFSLSEIPKEVHSLVDGFLQKPIRDIFDLSKIASGSLAAPGVGLTQG
jgi:CheY-like chemotaxis protein